jgi:NSS family neurotransmitter:Na+ symporter
MGLLECVVIGWLWRVDILRRHANSRSDWKIGKWWDYLIRIVIPVVLGTLFFWEVFDTIEAGSFFKTPEGQWIPGNCVGLGILLFLPIVAFFISLIKKPGKIEQHRPELSLKTHGKSIGEISLLASILIVGVIVVSLTVSLPNTLKTVLVWLSLIVGLFLLLLSNFVLGKYNTSTSKASWLIRWSGIIATMNTSASIAIILISFTQKVEVSETTAPIREQLSGVSYIILAVVLLIIVGGLGWCFYRALTAAGSDTGIQLPDEIGDDEKPNRN